MITGEKEWLETISKNQMCPEHKKEITIAWDGDKGVYFLRCGAGHAATGLTRRPTTVEEIKQAPVSVIPKTITLMPNTDLGSGHELSLEQMNALRQYAITYKLDPDRGHVCLMYGKPYITIDGYLYYAKSQKLHYKMPSRPMTPDERTSYQIKEGEHAWICAITFGSDDNLAIGIGIVTPNELTATSNKNKEQLRSPVVANHPVLMAQKRAEWQALRRAFPIGNE